MKKPRPRTARREGERGARKLVRAQSRLAELSPGGAPEWPITVESPSVIPVRARSQPCPLCGGALRLDDETAEIEAGIRLRAAHMTCVQCGIKRVLWFQIVISAPN